MPSPRDENGFGWTDLAWRSEADAWIRAQLGAEVAIEQPHVRPWATALRAATPDGPVWFKACIPALAFEVSLLTILGARGVDCLPRVIASDRARGWMLLEDAGDQLSEQEPNLERWVEFMGVYAQFQIDAATAADDLVRAGVPDSRTPRMFDDFTSLLEDERNLRASPEDFVSRDQVLALRALVPQLREHAARVDALGLPDSAQHDDLHQWNVHVRGDRYVFLDWGDACVSQPLLSLGVPIAHARYLFDERAPARIRDAYIEPWTRYATRAELLDACESSLLLAEITAILKWSRIYSGIAPEHRGSYDEVISDRAQDLLEAM